MNGNFRVFNLTRGFSIKHKQAVRAIRECSCEWVEYGVSVRDLTLAESISARNEQSRLREPLPYSELFGLSFQAPASAEERKRDNNLMIWAASRFVAEEMSRIA